MFSCFILILDLKLLHPLKALEFFIFNFFFGMNMIDE